MDFKQGRRMPLELLLASARVATVLFSYLLGLRRRKRYGDNW